MSDRPFPTPDEWLHYHALEPQSERERAAALYGRGETDAAREVLERLAAAGDRDAQYGLGNICSGAGSGAADYRSAERWWMAAAARGHAQAEFNVGVLHDTGDIGERSLEKAAEWYGRTAEGGHSKALARLAEMYDAGTGVSRDPVRACFYRQRLAAPSEAPASQDLRQSASDQLWTRRAAAAGEWPPDARTDGIRYLVHNMLAALLHDQGRVRHAEDTAGSLGSRWSFAEINLAIPVVGRVPNVAGFLFQSSDAPSRAPEALHIPTEELWPLARAGDIVLLTDASHTTSAPCSRSTGLPRVRVRGDWLRRGGWRRRPGGGRHAPVTQPGSVTGSPGAASREPHRADT